MPNIIDVLKNYPLEDLIQLADANPKIAAWCHDSEMQEHWEECWRHLGEKPNYKAATIENPYRELKPQDGFSAFTLVQGIMYYHLSRLYNNLDFLEKGADLGSFHAIHFAFTSLLNQLKCNSNKVFQLFKLIEKYELILKQHGTPGFLLLYEAYNEIGNFCKNNKPKTFPVKAEQMYCKAIDYLYVARLTRHSYQASTHNAYFGLENSMTALLKLETRDFQNFIKTYNDEKSHLSEEDFSKYLESIRALIDSDIRQVSPFPNYDQHPFSSHLSL